MLKAAPGMLVAVPWLLKAWPGLLKAMFGMSVARFGWRLPAVPGMLPRQLKAWAGLLTGGCSLWLAVACCAWDVASAIESLGWAVHGRLLALVGGCLLCLGC